MTTPDQHTPDPVHSDPETIVLDGYRGIGWDLTPNTRLVLDRLDHGRWTVHLHQTATPPVEAEATVDQVEHFARLLLYRLAEDRRAQQAALNATGHGAR